MEFKHSKSFPIDLESNEIPHGNGIPFGFQSNSSLDQVL